MYKNYGMDIYLLSTVCGCIEGNIHIDLENNTCFGWIERYDINFYNSDEYIFLNIYYFVKSTDSYCNFLISYFSLWHSNKSIYYDEFHISELRHNYRNLLALLKRDMKLACKKKDFTTKCMYKKIYHGLNSAFT